MKNNSFMDAIKIMAGKDPNEEPKRIKKTGKKKGQEKPETTTEAAPKRKPVATKDKFLDAYDYADTDEVKADLRNALRGGELSDDLSKLLQVLFDRKAFRDVVMAQADVRPTPPGPDEYYLEYRFVHPDSGDWCNEEAQELLDMGKTLDDLKKFNIELKVVRKRKLDNEEIQEGTPEDYEKVIKDFTK